MTTLVATSHGLHHVESGTRVFHGHAIDALSRGRRGWLFTVDGEAVARWEPDGTASDPISIEASINCVSEHGSSLVIGASQARLYQHSGDVTVLREDFEEAPGRDTWHTPWGGPPDVRSISVDADASTLYVNVHVGGVVRWKADDPVWRATMDIHADVHQVVAHPTRPGTVLAAAAVGLGISTDYGESWTWRRDGLHADYCRAVAVWDDLVLVSASLGSRGRNAAVYRGRLDEGSLAGCERGLPEWFSTNVNTHCLGASAHQAVIGDADGTLYQSTDEGETWEVAARLAPIRAVGLED